MFQVLLNTEKRKKMLFTVDMKWCLHPSLSKGFTLCLYLLQHTYLLTLTVSTFGLAAKVSHCDAHVVHVSVWSCFADAAFCVMGLPMHSCFWFDSFEGGGWFLWSFIVVFFLFFFYKSNIKCSIYWIYILVISLKEKKKNPVIPVWWCRAGFNLAQPVLLKSIRRERPLSLFNLWHETVSESQL